MEKNRLTNDKIEELVDENAGAYKGDSGINFIDASNLPVLPLQQQMQISFTRKPRRNKESNFALFLL